MRQIGALCVVALTACAGPPKSGTSALGDPAGTVDAAAPIADAPDARAPEDRDPEDPDDSPGEDPDDPPSIDEGCGGTSFEARSKPLEVLVLFDNSASMVLPVIGPGDQLLTLWDVAVAELGAFVNSPRSEGVALALKYFGSECDPSGYTTPDVPFGVLPEHASAIEQSLANTLPLSETATRPALQGALEFARTRAATADQDARRVILLVTDGYPDEMDCSDNTTESVSRVAANGLAGEPSIPTYVFVTVPDLALDAIAEAGGTERAIKADLASLGALAAALDGVRDQELAALPCEYDLPEEYYAQVGDPNLVNLTRDGRAVQRVGGQAACDEASDGWYYDDPEAPSRILTCPSTCASLKMAREVNILLDCPTVF